MCHRIYSILNDIIVNDGKKIIEVNYLLSYTLLTWDEGQMIEIMIVKYYRFVSDPPKKLFESH